MGGKILVLSGGVGGAKLVWGLAQALPPERLAVVVNTADDEVFHGLHVSPDLDTVLYTLAGLADPERGWGIAGDTFHALEMLGRYGAPTWFRLGDRDLATHILRTHLLRQGRTLSEVTLELAHALGVRVEIVPMSDEPVRTVVHTDEGDLPFQEYFVRRNCTPAVRGLRYQGAESARPSPRFQALLHEARALIFSTSNPFFSIFPILALPGVRERVAAFPGPRVAISPVVGGETFRGPLDRLLRDLEGEVSPTAVARLYRGLCDIFVLDEVDREREEEVRRLGFRVEIAPTVMRTPEDRVALARRILALLEG